MLKKNKKTSKKMNQLSLLPSKLWGYVSKYQSTISVQPLISNFSTYLFFDRKKALILLDTLLYFLLDITQVTCKKRF